MGMKLALLVSPQPVIQDIGDTEQPQPVAGDDGLDLAERIPRRIAGCQAYRPADLLRTGGLRRCRQGVARLATQRSAEVSHQATKRHHGDRQPREAEQGPGGQKQATLKTGQLPPGPPLGEQAAQGFGHRLTMPKLSNSPTKASTSCRHSAAST